MAINKDSIRQNLQQQLEQRLTEFVQEVLRNSGQSFDELQNSVKDQIRQYTKTEAEKLAQGIVDGLDVLRQTINTNINKINELETRINNINTTSTTTP